METVIRYKRQWQRDERTGRMMMERVPYEKVVLSEEEKIRIVSEYVQGKTTASRVVEEYRLSGKQVLFNWIDRYLVEESLPLPGEQPEGAMTRTSPEERLKGLESENRRLRKALELERLRSKAYSTMIDVAEQTFNIPVRKKSGTKR